jgi:signal transduction histidine kinase
MAISSAVDMSISLDFVIMSLIVFAGVAVVYWSILQFLELREFMEEQKKLKENKPA